MPTARFFFDPGSGTVLWRTDPERDEYFVDLDRLAVSDDLRATLQGLVAEYDSSMNWDYPPDPSPWRQERCDRFNADVREAQRRLVAELGPEWELEDGFVERAEDPDLERYLADPAGFRRVVGPATVSRRRSAERVTPAPSGRRLRSRLLYALGIAVYFGAAQESARGVVGHERWDWFGMALNGGLMGVFYVFLFGPLLTWTQRAADHGRLPRTRSATRETERNALLALALQSGHLPADADAARWRPALTTQRKQSLWLGWLAVGGAVGVAALVGVAGAVANDNAWGVWLVAAVVAAESVPVAGSVTRQRRVIDSLLHQLPQADDRAGTR